MTKRVKNVSIICFHDELCQVYNALVTALSLMREGAKVTLFFGSRGVNAVHKEKVKDLKCLPDKPKKEGETVMTMMEDMDLPSAEDMFFMLIAEGGTVLVCNLNVALFKIPPKQLIDDEKVVCPAKFYKETVIPSDMTLTF